MDVRTADVVFIGMCPFYQMGVLPDAKSNPFFKDDTNYILHVTDVCSTKGEALKTHSNRIRDNGPMPIMNKHGYFYKRKGLIECIETGVTYQTASEAARINGSTQSNLSNHLNNKPGFRSVKGKTYRYVVDKVNVTR